MSEGSPPETDDRGPPSLVSPCSKRGNLKSQTPGRFAFGERFCGVR